MSLEELDLEMGDSARFAGAVFGGVKDGYFTDVSDRYCSTSRAVVLSVLSRLEVRFSPMVIVEMKPTALSHRGKTGQLSRQPLDPCVVSNASPTRKECFPHKK